MATHAETRSAPPPFKQRCVQDLAWVIASPPLISGNINAVNWWDTAHMQREYAACLPALHQLDKHPAPLLDAIATAKSQRLGHYFETLVAHWFHISPNYELLLRNYQLHNAQQTLGELDFLVQEHSSGKRVHLEVSVKFYLGTGDLNQMANWHGPNLKDRLDRKFQHLCTHQTQLARKYPKHLPYSADEAACLIKGRLFYPADAVPTTHFVNPQHLYGRWYELPTTPQRTSSYLCLGKQRWLATVHDAAEAALVTLPAKLDTATLYANYSGQTERERFFLLPAGWKARIPSNTSTPPAANKP